VLTRTFFCMCHGATQTTSLPLDEMSNMPNFQIGIAFAPEEEPAQRVEVDATPAPPPGPAVTSRIEYLARRALPQSP
jgi:hypothetical protein